MTRSCMEMLEAKWDERKFLCVGLDSAKEMLPPLCWQPGQKVWEAQFIFNKAIIDATADTVCVYKPNFAFYASQWIDGFMSLEKTIEYIHERYPGIPVIGDGKWGDIQRTTKEYATMVFDRLAFDAITAMPYLGQEGALEPFFERKEKLVFVVCGSSNEGAKEFQNFKSHPRHLAAGYAVRSRSVPLYEYVAYRVSNIWNGNGNCGLVAAATEPRTLRKIRGVAPDIPILIPGIGAQGGNLKTAVRYARDANGRGFIVNASSSIIFASDKRDFAQAARKEAVRLDKAIIAILEEKGGKK